MTTNYPDMRGMGECHPCASEAEALALAAKIGGIVCVLKHTAPKEYVDWFVASQDQNGETIRETSGETKW